MKYADSLDQLEDKKLIVPAEDVSERDIEDYYPLLGTRHVDPDNGLMYEITAVFQDKRGYNLVYRRLVTRDAWRRIKMDHYMQPILRAIPR